MDEHNENMYFGATPEIFEFAKKNRVNPTPAEEYLWNFLCKNQLNNLRFKRQHPIGNYIADFYCHSAKLVIELDGSIHKLEAIKNNDREKDDFLLTNNLRVLRFTNQEVIKNIYLVLNKIKESTNSHLEVLGSIVKSVSPPLGVRSKLIECPRDAIQGLHQFISTEKKAKYINLLLKSNLFDTIDFGSFVSPKAIPQMADTAEVVKKLNLSNTKSKLLAIIANERGANEACQFDEISYLGYPFSISETFQLRNTNATILESLERVKVIQEITQKANKQLVIYISMGFGNPYGDDWNAEIAIKWVDELQKSGVSIFSLSDTVGIAKPNSISYLFENLIPKYPNLEFGAHLHTTPNTWKEKVDAAYNAGCKRFDGAILGYGGCPMAADDLVGNMATENLLNYLDNTDYQLVNELKSAFQEMIN